jgi:hypothetical protein
MESSGGYVALAVTADRRQIRMLLALPLPVQLCISDLRTDSSDGNSTDRFEEERAPPKLAGHVQRLFFWSGSGLRPDRPGIQAEYILHASAQRESKCGV